MTKSTGPEKGSSGIFDTARIWSPAVLLYDLSFSTDIGLVSNFLIHDAIDLRWSAKARISGEIGSDQYGQMSQGEVLKLVPRFRTRPMRVPAPGRTSPCSTVGDFVYQNGG